MQQDPTLELNKARAKAQSIIDEAKAQSIKIIADAYGAEIQKVAAQIAVQFRDAAIAEIDRFKNELQLKIAAVEAETEKVLSDKYKKADAEIEKYKASKMAQIDIEIKTVLIDVSKKVIGKSIDVRTQEDLVIRALEDAKRQNIL